MNQVNLEPTPNGYLQMAKLFHQEITKNLPDSKLQVLRSLIEITAFLAANHPEEYKKLMNPLGGE